MYFIQQCLQPETNIVLVHHSQASFNTGHLAFQVGHLPATEMEIANNAQCTVGYDMEVVEAFKVFETLVEGQVSESLPPGWRFLPSPIGIR